MICHRCTNFVNDSSLLCPNCGTPTGSKTYSYPKERPICRNMQCKDNKGAECLVYHTPHDVIKCVTLNEYINGIWFK